MKPLSPVPSVEVEQDLYAYEQANNGAGPQWCFGSPTVVRLGEEVFVTGLETIAGAKPLNNTRWILMHVPPKGAPRCVYRDGERTREPSPMGATRDGRIFVTANPARTPLDAYSGPAAPTLVEFDARKPEAPLASTEVPWGEKPSFTEHSYRSLAIDAARGEAVYINNIGYHHAHWSFRDAGGKWPAQGRVTWPLMGSGAGATPLRICYPSVVLHDRAVHIFGSSDITEPDEQYKRFKLELTKSQWDYLFCRVLYAYTPDITSKPFSQWVEVANHEATRGTLLVCDQWRSPAGVHHMLWAENTVDVRLREKFFPQAKPKARLMHARVVNGRVESTAAVMEGEPGVDEALPDWGRFHVTPSGRVLVLATVNVAGKGGSGARTENRLIELDGQGRPQAQTTLTLEHPFRRLFFTATPRGGSAPSGLLDVAGECAQRPNVIRYARVRVE